MYTRHRKLIAAVSLCLIAGSANAAIINYTSQVNMEARANADYALGVVWDDQLIQLNDVANYTNTLLASSTFGSQTANATSAIIINADLMAGIFSASGSYSFSASTSRANAGADDGISMNFYITTPYSYTIDITASAGSASSVDFSGSWPSIHTSYENGGISIHQSGILTGMNAYNISANIYGCVIGCLNTENNGDFQYTLTLTPTAVPVPPAAWLLGSGLLGLIGVARRKAA